ncbi:MAG: ABC transporter permease [Spirochaetes bacterium DG_61]|jgi:putative spermidine/putrescine transport system permease protein|nr:MAG: ABC transporter permease [Spirochaetes bacterium DG_61]
MRDRAVVYLKLSPLLLPFAVIFSTGIFLAFLQSLGYFLPIPVQGGLFAAYRSLFRSLWFYQDFAFTLYCAFCSALLSVSVGTALAYGIWRLPIGLQKIGVLTKIPLILPHIAVAFIVLMFFSKTGYISSFLFQAGIIESAEEFPPILFGGRGWGIILAYVYKEVPFVVLLVSSVLKKFEYARILTAQMLGASRLTVFFRVVFPFLTPVVNTSFIILFLYSFGAFDIPFLLGESHPGMLSIQVYNLYFKRDLMNRPSAMAILVVMFLFSLVFIYLYSRLAARLEREGRKL